jgi:hypothetical protein
MAGIVAVFVGPTAVLRELVGAVLLDKMLEEPHPPSRVCEIFGGTLGHVMQ